MKPKRREFVVSLDMPAGLTVGDVGLFIAEAIKLHQGSMPAEEPAAGIDVRSLKVKTIPNAREAGIRK